MTGKFRYTAVTILLLGAAVCSEPSRALPATTSQCLPPAWPSPPPLGLPPAASMGMARDFPTEWKVPLCVAWDSQFFPEVAAVHGSIDALDVNSLLERIGAVSSFTHMPYWSVTDHRLETLITNSFAALLEQPTKPRPDYAFRELQVDQELYFSEQDNRLPDPVIYRIRIIERDEHHFVIDISNVTAAKKFFLTLLSPGDMRMIIFVSATKDGGWTCYALSGVHASKLASIVENPKSQLNRLLAFYGFISGADIATLPWAK